jgi:hypothetical protein
MKTTHLYTLFIVLFASFIFILKLLPGIPNAIDTGAHLFRLIYLNKHLKNGIVPLWNTEWYAGSPFLLQYPPLAFYYSSFWPINDYVFLYKFIEVIFELFLIVAVYMLSKTVLNRKDLALLSTFLFVIIPQNIWNFSVVDRYATILEAFFLVTSLMFFLKFLFSKKNRYKIFSGVFLGLGLLSQGFGYIIMLVALIILKIVAWEKIKIKDLFTIVAVSLLVASPWLILSVGSFLYYIQNPSETVLMLRPSIDITRFVAVLFSLGLPLIACLILKFHTFKKWRKFIGVCLIFSSFTVFFIEIPLKYNITKPTIFFTLLLTAIIVLTANKNVYQFNDSLKYLFYLTIFLTSSSAVLISLATFLSIIDPQRIAFYASVPLVIVSASILQKNKYGLALSIISLLLISFTFLSTPYTNMLKIDENFITTLKNSKEEGRMLIVEPEMWMHALPALTDKPSIDGYSPWERYLPYFRNLRFLNNFGLWSEGTTLEQKQEVYDQVFLNVSKFAIKYVVIHKNSPIKLPAYLDFQTEYDKNGWKILKIKQPISLIDNATLVQENPNELTIYPKADRMLLKQTYFPGWQISCGRIKRSADGLTIIENNNCEKIVLKYNPLSALPQFYKK